MRAIWTGALGFGLVNIPVRLYSAVGGESDLDLDMLHKKDLSPIRYARICKTDGKEVPYEDIVKGFEYRKGDYVVLTDEDFKKAYPKKTKTIDILNFAYDEEVDGVFYERPYFLAPEKGAENAYSLLREALYRSKKIGIASYVLRNKEHLAAVKPYGNAIILNQLRFVEELRPTDGLELPDYNEKKSKELEVAVALIDQLTEEFEPQKYQDTFKREIRQVIEQKAKGKPIKPRESEEATTEVSDLMAALKQSLQKQKVKA